MEILLRDQRVGYGGLSDQAPVDGERGRGRQPAVQSEEEPSPPKVSQNNQIFFRRNPQQKLNP